MSSDPRFDDRADDLLSADPNEVAALSQHFRGLCDALDRVRNGLAGANTDPSWSGPAADEFRQHLGQLPGELDTLYSSYDHLAWALWSYQGPLASAKSRFRRLSGDLYDAHARLDQANQQISNGGDATHYQPLADQAQNDVENLNTQGNSILDDFEYERRLCVNRIGEAAGNTFGNWWDRYVVDDVGNFMVSVATGAISAVETVAKVVVAIVESVAKAVHDLGGHFWDWVRDPLNLDKLAKFAGDLGTVLTVVAVIAALCIPGVGWAMAAIAIASDAASGIQVVDDLVHGNLGAAGLDALGLIPVGGKAAKEAKLAEDAVSGAKGAVTDTVKEGKALDEVDHVLSGSEAEASSALQAARTDERFASQFPHSAEMVAFRDRQIAKIMDASRQLRQIRDLRAAVAGDRAAVSAGHQAAESALAAAERHAKPIVAHAERVEAVREAVVDTTADQVKEHYFPDKTGGQ